MSTQPTQPPDDWLELAIAKTRSSFQEKFHKIRNNKELLLKLAQTPPTPRSHGIEIYRNKYLEFVDGLVMGLGYFYENPKMEYMLYRDIEPYMDSILADEDNICLSNSESSHLHDSTRLNSESLRSVHSE